MCISNDPADFKNTKGYIGEARLKDLGLVHVLGYQNQVQNKSTGPNAMILHFPSKEAMGKKNVIELGDEGANLLNHYCNQFSSSFSRGTKSVASNGVEIFKTGIYTVVISDKPTLINSALSAIPKKIRPSIHPELMAWYEKVYPGYSIALCCFDNKELVSANPLFWWYKPINEDELFFPAIDAHEGGVPDLSKKVTIDHVLTCSVIDFSCPEKTTDVAHLKSSLPTETHKFLPDTIMGKAYQNLDSQMNGDFIIPKSRLREGHSLFDRRKPTSRR